MREARYRARVFIAPPDSLARERTTGTTSPALFEHKELLVMRRSVAFEQAHKAFIYSGVRGDPNNGCEGD